MGYPTTHRHFLDKLLNESRILLYGNVLDIGGKKDNKAGQFRPHNKNIISWKYVNIDPDTNPDFLVDAVSIPVTSGSIDSILLCETLEHVIDPAKVIREAHRLLKADGNLIVTMPFMTAVHAEPFDYQRWTNTKIDLELSMAGFININIKPMGGWIAIIYDVFRNELRCRIKKGSYKAKIMLKVLRLFYRPVILLSGMKWCTELSATTGWFITCSKNDAK